MITIAYNVVDVLTCKVYHTVDWELFVDDLMYCHRCGRKWRFA